MFSCSDCALTRLSENVNQLVEASLEIITDCTLTCLENTKNAFGNFTDKLVEMISEPKIVKVNSMQQFNSNIKKVLSELQIPQSRLFCKILHKF